MQRKRDDAAVGHVTSFVVGLAIFMLVFATLMVFLSTSVRNEVNAVDESVDLDARSTIAMRAITTTPGIPANWQTKSSTVDPSRFGLLKDGSASTVDATKLQAFNRDLNSLEWYYASGKRLFGLTDYDFHLRSYPLLRPDADATIDGMTDFKVAYVGNHTKVGPLYIQSATTTTVDATLIEAARVNFTNAVADLDGSGVTYGIFGTGGTYPTQSAALTRHLPLRMAGFSYSEDVVSTLASNDSYWQVVSLTDFSSGSAPTIPDVDRPERVLTASKREWTGGSEVWDYDLRHPADPSLPDRAIFGPYDFSGYSGGVGWLNFTHHVDGFDSGAPINDDYARVQYYCTSGCAINNVWTNLTLGEWQQRNGGASGFFANDNLSLAPVGGGNAYLAFAWYPGKVSSVKEGWFITNFSVNATQAGVTTQIVQNKLDYRTRAVDAVVVGSTVDHDAFNDAATGYVFKHAIRDFVTAGGGLAVFGSDDTANEWLAPKFTANGAPTASGPLLPDASDFSHPLLNNPHQLGYTSYKPFTAASFTPSNRFTDVVVAADSGGSSTVPLLSVSNANPSWNGTVILTSYAPSPLGQMPATSSESLKFVTNVLAYMRYAPLYVDWGGALPATTAVGSASRTMLVDGTSLGLGTPQVFLTLYVWR